MKKKKNTSNSLLCSVSVDKLTSSVKVALDSLRFSSIKCQVFFSGLFVVFNIFLIKCLMICCIFGSHAFKSSKQPPYPLNFARGRALSSSTIPKSSSLWFTRKFDHPQGSSRPHIRHQGQTYLCNSFADYFLWFPARILI